MKLILSSLFCIIGFAYFSQVNQKENTAPTNQNTPVSNSERVIKQDSISTLKESKDSETSSKKLKYSAKKTEATSKSALENKAETFYQIKSSSNTQYSQRSPTPIQQKEMDNTVEYYQKNAPNSFEYHYFKYVSGNYNLSLINELKEAQKLKPNNVDVQVQFAAFNFIKRNKEELKKNLEFLLKNKKIEEEILIYSEDLLKSVEPNGTLLTHGFDDTYGVLYLQYIKNIRTDVKLISFDFIQSMYYQKLLETENYNVPIEKSIDVNFFKKFCEVNPTKKIQLSMTFPKPYLEAVKNDLQILGLTFIYNNQTLDLYEKNYQFYKNLNKTQKITDLKTDKCKKLSSNYLPALLSLKSKLTSSNYETNSNKESENIEKLINQISVQSNTNQHLKSYK